MATYRVAQGTQIHHDGVVYGQGETLEAEPEQARIWLQGDWVSEVAKPAAKKTSARKTSAK